MHYPWVLSVVFKCFAYIRITDQIAFLCVHAPRGHIYKYICVFCPPPPLSDENPVMLHFFAYAEIIFAHILVFPACAIEVQHTNENSPTIDTVPCSHVIQVSPPGYIFVREPSHGYRKRCIYAGLHHLSGTHFEARAHVEINEISLLHEFAYGQLLLSCVAGRINRRVLCIVLARRLGTTHTVAGETPLL